MRQIVTFLIIIFASFVQAQSKTFNLLDSNLHVGQEYTTRKIYFELGKANLKPESNSLLDSIVTFLNRSEIVKVEIQVHSDSRTNPNCCSVPTENRAKSISEYLVFHGVSVQKIVAKGYGEVKLLITDKEINNAKTKNDKEALHALNRRVVIKIIELKAL